MTTTQQAALLSDAYAQGVEAAASLLTRMADEYALEHGHDDMGALSFGSGPRAEAKMEWHSSLIELAEEIRRLDGAKLQATQAEPAQAGELPPLPEHIGEIIGIRQTPTDTPEFWGYFEAGFKTDKKQHVYTADQMHAYARAALAARKPLTRKQINEASRDAQMSFCLKVGGTYEEELARAIERAHGINGLEVKP